MKIHTCLSHYTYNNIQYFFYFVVNYEVYDDFSEWLAQVAQHLLAGIKITWLIIQIISRCFISKVANQQAYTKPQSVSCFSSSLKCHECRNNYTLLAFQIYPVHTTILKSLAQKSFLFNDPENIFFFFSCNVHCSVHLRIPLTYHF